jgi:molybdenum cofactor cytidylyltransferase
MRGLDVGAVSALIPAAGFSSRMGKPKSLLPVAGRPMLEHVGRAFVDGGASPLVVVIPPESRPESRPIRELVERLGGVVVMPVTTPPDMTGSIVAGLAELPAGPFLVAPGDIPAIHAGVVAKLIEIGRLRPDRIAIAAHGGRRAHPLLIPGDLADELRRDPPASGLDRWIRSRLDRVLEVEFDDSGLLEDIDTPEEYRRRT